MKHTSDQQYGKYEISCSIENARALPAVNRGNSGAEDAGVSAFSSLYSWMLVMRVLFLSNGNDYKRMKGGSGKGKGKGETNW